MQDNSLPLPDNISSRWQEGGKPAAMYPRLFNPQSGIIVTANNHLLFTPQGVFIRRRWISASIRAYGIKKSLEKLDQVDVQSMYELQHNDTDYLMQQWATWLQRCLAKADPDNQTYLTMRKLLAQWDGTADKNSTAYALLNAWRTRLYGQLFNILDEEFQKGWPGTVYSQANRRWDETVHTLMTHNRWVPDGFQRLDGVLAATSE
ncbi:penicillin acylase family protein [Vibrio sp. PP-XX7]